MKMTKPESLDDMMQQVLAVRGVTPVQGMSVDPRVVAPDPIARAFAAPVSAERYQIAVPPDMMRDAELEAKARQWFHRAGLPQGAVSGIIQEYCRQLCANDQSMDAGGAQRIQAELAQEWGPDYQRKVEAARALVAKSGGAAELAEILGSSGLGDNPWLIRTLATLAESKLGGGGDK
jgi:hypothetical protein